MDIGNFYKKSIFKIHPRILMICFLIISGWGIQKSTAQCSIDCSNITDTVYQCFESLPLPDPGLVILIGCSGNALVYSIDLSNNATGCGADTLTITRLYIVDFDGDTTNTTSDRDTCTQLLQFIDDVAPVLTCPSNVTIECSASTLPANTGVATATDACDLSPTILFFDYPNTPPTASPEIRIVFLPAGTVTGSCTSGTNCQNNTICFGLEYTPGVSGTLTSYTTGFFVNCFNGNTPIISNASCVMADNSGEIDDCGGSGLVLMNSSGNSGVVPVIKDVPVILHQICFQLGNGGSILLDEDEATDLTTSIDLPGGGLSTEQPAFTNFTVDFDTYCVETCPYPYSIYRKFIAVDDCGNQSTCIQQITLQDHTSPTFTCPANITIQCTESTDPQSTGMATATDNCVGVPTLTFSDVTVAGVCPMEMTITRTWTAIDDCGNSGTCSQTIFVDDSAPPVLSCPPNITVECGTSTATAATGDATATDNCDGIPTIGFSDVTIAGACSQDYIITRTFTAIDDCGNSSTCNQIISVADTNPPTITCPANVTIECSESTLTANTGDATATDICDPSPLIQYIDYFDTPPAANPEMRWIYMPPGTASGNCVSGTDCQAGTICFALQYTPGVTGILTSYTTGFFVDCYNGNTPIISNASCVMADNSGEIDDCGGSGLVLMNSSGNSGVLPVTQNIPVILHQVCFQLGIGGSILLDEDEATDLTASVELPGGGLTTELPAFNNFTIDFDTYCEESCPYPSTIYREFAAIDACGNQSTCVQQITIQDLTAPIITCPADVTIQCNTSTDTSVTGVATATDNCDAAPVITSSDNTVGGNCPQEYTISRTWRATDICGNSSTCIQIIFIDDSTPPVISCPADLTIQCNASSAPTETGSATATDNCDVNVIPTFTDVTIGGNCPQEVTITRTWNATDACGNSSTCLQTIFVDDSIPPVLTCPPDITVQCNTSIATATTGDATATDNCDVVPTIGFSDVTVGGACPQEITITRTFTAIDDCGNSSTCAQIIFVHDTTPPLITCPANVTIECNTSSDPATTGSTTATDNCDASVIPTFTDVTVAGACPQELTITRTWNATDDCGNSSSCVQIIFVDDSTPPVLTCPANTTIQCNTSSDPIVTGTAFAFDNCDPSVVPTFSDITVGGACPQELTITRTWLAADDCGNSSSCVQIIFVDDSTPPSITCPSDITIECSTSSDPTATGSATATDNCDASVIPTFSDVTVGGICPQEVTITRTWNATDDCGNSSSCVQTIFIDDSTPPVLTCPVNITIECTASIATANTGDATATDNCDGTPTIGFSDVTVAGACPQEYTISRLFTAIDDCGNTSTCEQSIFVDDSNAPVIICPPNMTIECSASTAPANTGTATATDNCDGTLTITSSDVTVAGTCPQALTITRTWRAADDCGNSSTCVQTIAVVDTIAPSITCPSNVTIECSESTLTASTGDASASDLCDPNPLIQHIDFFDTPPAGSPEMRWVFMPAGTILGGCVSNTDCQSGTICFALQYIPGVSGILTSYTTGFFVDCYNGNTPIVSNASCVMADNSGEIDDCGGTGLVLMNCSGNSGTLAITQNVPVILHQICFQLGNGGSILLDEDESTDLTASVDLPGGGLATERPAFTNFTVNFDTYCVQSCLYPSSIYREFIAVDACGNQNTCVQQITIQDLTAPVITCPADLTIECNASSDPLETGSATATDNCDTSVVITYSDVTVGGICPQELTITRTWNAQDVCGNSSQCVQTIFVQDTVAPILSCPVDITVDCNTSIATVVTGDATATDNCDSTPVIGFDDVTAAGACPQSYIITRTFTAIDDCGNSSSCTQTIFVQDTTPPAITCPVDLTIECDASSDPLATGSATATDNCDASVVITYADVTVAGACAQSMTITRTWNASDACGNSSTCLQTIFVDDNAAPAITCPPNITIQCTASTLPANTGTVTATDNCDGTPTITSTDVTIAGGCPQEYTINRTWNVADDCGNSSSCVQTIFVDDNAAPSITCPAPVTVSCASQVPAADIGSVSASDDCGTVTITSLGDVISNQTCVNRFTITRTYRAADACGNSSTCIQIITVNDQTPPTILCPANVTITLQDNTLPANTGSPTATDDCTGIPVVSFSDVTIAGQCSTEYIINRTWNATDQCGNSSTCLQTIAVLGGCTVDLALVKTLDPNQGPVSGGDNLNFTITITNQGEIAISSVSIVDYIPIGFALNDPDWTAGNVGSSGQSASITLSIGNGGLGANGLIAGASVSVPITLQANINIPPGVYFNAAEITQVIDINGIDVTNNDVDSTPDDIDTNDPPGEDDHSLAEICVLPNPVIIGDAYVCPGELVTYSVANPNPNNTYVWTLSGGGIIVQNNGSSIQIQWQQPAGGPFQISVQEIASQTCQNTGFLNVFIQGFEPIACNDLVQISLDSNGIAIIDPSMILEGENPANNNYYVVITDENGNIVPGNVINCSYVGQTLIVAVHNICNNQSCWGRVLVEDKLPPHIVCTCPVENTDTACEITCLEVNQLVAGIIPPQLQPTVTDNCSATVAIANIDLNDEGCGGGYIRVTWLATDPSGNTASCVQQFNIVPLTLETLVCPPNYIGECGTSTDPDVTGWPTVSGHPLSDQGGLCNIFTGYWDHPLVDCGGGQKIQRTWTILDWCTTQLVECTQIIKLADTEGPVLSCPNDITVGTDFWYCYSNFSVPKPQAADACSEIESYQLIASAGTVVSFGSNYVVNNLPIGTHILQWVVTDECGNSSSCSFKVTVEDNVVPVVNCDAHTIVSLTNDGPSGITLVPAEVFDDGSYDNCGPVTFRARRIESCIDIDWTTEGACIDDIPGGVPPVNSRDRGTVHRPCVPFSCCDVGAGPVMVELEVTDAAGNKNYCMVEATVQDKISAFIECPPDIIVSCDYWFPAEEGTYVDADGNHNGNLDEDPLSRTFGNMYDAFHYDESIRQPIIINDPGNDQYLQPHDWGLDGWADDNCEVNLQVRVRVVSDCSGGDLPGNAPPGAVKLIERRFIAEGASGDAAPATCTQRIWVVDYHPFYITDNTCNNNDPNDGVIWPCDVILTTCPEDISGTGEPTIFDDACNLIGVTYEDTRFDFVEGACYKILRDWAIIDWCQYNAQTGYGLWHYTQVIKVHDNDGPLFLDCPTGPVTLCVQDTGVTLPDNNQAFLGEGNPLSSSCSVHLNLSKTVYEACSGVVQYDVKLYPFNGSDYLLLQGTTSAPVDSNHHAVLTFDTRNAPIQDVRLNGIPYNNKFCGDYHRILWSVEDGCGNWSHCEYLLRLEDCKQPSPVCINGLSTVVMPIGGQVTIWAKDFNASSFDDCTKSEDLLYSFSGDSYEPSHTYTCDNVPAFGVELSTQIWVADGGVDHNCNGVIEWSERNKDYCTTTIVITDNNDVCGGSGSILAGEVLTSAAVPVEKVNVTLNSVGHYFPPFITVANGKYKFNHLDHGTDYSIVPERNDNPRNGVSTLDLVKIQKHLLGIEPFTSPYQYIAADANNNKAVSAIDLVEIRKLILGIYNNFPDNKSWRFVEKGFPMTTDHPWPFDESIFIPGLSVDSIMANDFVAVKIGDVNNSAKANVQQILPRDATRILTATADACEVEAGETCVMRMTLPEVLSGFQWTFETEGLEFAGVSSEDIHIGDDNVGLLDHGIVTMSWNGEVKPDQHSITITLTWKANTAGRFDHMIRMTDLVTPVEAYTPSGDLLDVRLMFTGIGQESDFALYQNKPNPFDGFTSIGFVLPQDASAILTIYDVTGKEVYRKAGSYTAGYNAILLSQKDLPNSGVMYYKLESGGYSASKKMVLIR